MILGMVSVVLIMLWSGLMIADICPQIRVMPYLLSHAAVYASVFVYRIDNYNYWYAIAVMAVTVAAVLWRVLRDKSSRSIGIWCGVSTLLLGLYVFVFYYLLPSAVSILDLAH